MGLLYLRVRAAANVGERSCSNADGDREVRLLVKRGIDYRSIFPIGDVSEGIVNDGLSRRVVVMVVVSATGSLGERE